MMKDSVVFLCEVVGGGLTGTLIGAIILKVSCVLYNMPAGASAAPSDPPDTLASESKPETGTDSKLTSVPKPSMEWAMCIVFVAALVDILAGFILFRLLRFAGLITGLSTLSMPIYLASFPLVILIRSGIIAAMLPTSFGKGLLVTLISLFLDLLVAAVVVVAWILIAMAFGLSLPRFDWWNLPWL